MSRESTAYFYAAYNSAVRATVRALAWRRFLRATPFATSTVQGHSDERYRRIALTVATSGVNRGLAIVTSLISVPLSFHYLGAERYGLWMTISSTVGLLTFADLGLGSGVINAILRAGGPDDEQSARVQVASTFYVLAAIALFILLCMISVGSATFWERVFNVHSELAAKECVPTVAAIVFCTAAAIPFGLVQRVQLAYQEGFITNLWQCAGNMAALVCLVAAVSVKGGLPLMALALTGPPVVASAINHAVYFTIKRPSLAPRLGSFNCLAAKQIAASGPAFLLVQISAILGAPVDNLIVSHVIGPDAVAAYAVPSRLFGLTSILMSILVMPFWGPYGEAWRRGDLGWIQRAFWRTFWMSLLVNAGVCALFVVAGGQVIQTWVGGDVRPSLSLLIALAVWTLSANITFPCFVLLFGVGALRYLALAILAVMPPSVLLKVMFAKSFGLVGISWGGSLAQIAVFAIPIFYYIDRLLKDRSNSSGELAAQSPGGVS